MRALACLKHDVKLQLRHGFYHAYIAVCAAYVALLFALPAAPREWALPIILYSDPGMLGFYFIGGIVLLEKGENTLSNLFVTPLRIREYFLGKVISLTLLAVVTGLAITIATRRALNFRPGLLVLALSLTSLFFILTGIIAVARMKRLNEYIFYSSAFMAVLNLPLLDALGLWRSPLFWFTPTHASITLIRTSLTRAPGAGPGGETLLAAAVLCSWTGLAYLWARRWFVNYVVRHAGDAP